MKHKYLLIFSLLLGLSQFLPAQKYKVPVDLKQGEYVENTLIFRVKPEYKTWFEDGRNLKTILDALGGGRVKRNFPAAENNRKNPAGIDFRLVYEMSWNGRNSIQQASGILERLGIAEWAQPRYKVEPMYVPNDPAIPDAWHLEKIKAFEAWDIERGDTTVVIANTDAGIQFEHEDMGNIKYNYDDPLNGLDDDNDGYVDNYRGWNFPANTNNPTATLSPHGLATSGLHSASADNGKGAAGTGFRCKFLPLRIDGPNGFTHGYEAVVYAADHGCKIINASWGNTRPSPLGEEAIRYAIAKGCLIVAAAGNSGLDEKYYPASYPGVLSVGATDTEDGIWADSTGLRSTYNNTVDIVAPGKKVHVVSHSNGYSTSSGTSFAAPIVSGAAALVWSKFPHYTAAQVAERLRVTADTGILHLEANRAFTGKLGSGRLNMFEALNAAELPSIRVQDIEFADNDGNNFLQSGDTVLIWGRFKNYLAPTHRLQVKLSSYTPFVEVIDNDFTAGELGSLQAKDNASNPFRFRILPGAPADLVADFRIDYIDTLYRAFENFELLLNKTYIDLHENNVRLTITSRGSNGYNGDYAEFGSGFVYKSDSASLFYYSGLMLGSAGKVANNAYSASLPGFDNDFTPAGAVVDRQIPDGGREIQSSYYTDSPSGRISVRQRSRAFTTEEDKNSVYIEYTLLNEGTADINDLYAGNFTDWDIPGNGSNRAAFDGNLKLSYAWNALSGRYAGFQLIGENVYGYAFNSDGAGGSINIYNGFSDIEKYNVITGAARRNQSVAGDISNSIASGPFQLAVGDSIKLKFVVHAAESLEELQASAKRAIDRINFESLDAVFGTMPRTCDGEGGSVYVTYEQRDSLEIELLNSDGISLVRDTVADGSFSYSGLPAGDYQLMFRFGLESIFYTGFSIEDVIPVNAEATVSDTETLAGEEIHFTGSADGANQYFWDFGDGVTVFNSDTNYVFADTGFYTVRFIAWNASCSDTVEFQVRIMEPSGWKEPVAGDLRVYPNPTMGLVVLEVPKMLRGGKLEVFSSLGNLCRRYTLNEFRNELRLEQLEPSLYYLVISKGDVRETRVVSVQR